MNKDKLDGLSAQLQLPLFLIEDEDFIKKFISTIDNLDTDDKQNSVENSSSGVKFDNGKCAISLIPPELILSVGDILTFGAQKYTARNWEKGMNYSRVYSALQRHLIKWWDPYQSDVDEETGKSHLAHAACCIAFLLSYEARGEYGEFDDRATKRDNTRVK